jgi:hypothetical protein
MKPLTFRLSIVKKLEGYALVPMLPYGVSGLGVARLAWPAPDRQNVTMATTPWPTTSTADPIGSPDLLLALHRRHEGLLVLLALASFVLYAAGVVMLHQNRAPGWSLEASGALPAAVSHWVYGTPFGAMEHDVWLKFEHPGDASVQDVLAMAASKSIPPGLVDSTTLDGGGAGTNVFVTIATGLFGIKLSSLVKLYLVIVGVSAVAFMLRFPDRRLFALLLYFLVATVMLLTPLGSSDLAVDQTPIGGQRYFVMAAILSALYIFFEIIDRGAGAGSRRTLANAALLLLQALLLFGALLVRSSAGYLLGVLFVVWLWRLYRERRQPDQRRTLLRTGAVVAAAFGVYCVFAATALSAYVHNGRIFGNVWHRAFISFIFHPDWPFGNLRQVYDCTRYIPEGLNRQNMDRNGHCVWLVYPPNATRPLGDVIAGTYDGEYEKALRQAFFYVASHYPRQTFELYAIYKTALVENTMQLARHALFKLYRAPVAKAFFALAAAQLLVFVAFMVAVARVERTVVDPPLVIFALFFVASIPPLYVAWSTLATATDMIFLLYSSALLGALLLVQFVVQAVLRLMPARVQPGQ